MLNYKIFIAYSRRDAEYLDRLRSHLKALERREESPVEVWYDGLIEAASIWENVIKNALHNADLILLLISSDFISSDYCYNIEMKEALELHEQGKTKVIPIIVRNCLWAFTPFAKLQALPPSGKPITSKDWDTEDTPYFQIVNSIANIIDNLAYDQKIQVAKYHVTKEEWMEAIVKFEEAKNLISEFENKRNELNMLDEQIETCRNEHRYMTSFSRGEKAFSENNYRDAIVYFKEALRFKSSNQVEAMIRRCEEAIKFQMQDIEKQSYYDILEKADSQKALKNWDQALKNYQEAKSFYQEGFEPTLAEVNQKIEICRKALELNELVKQANLAFQNKDWLGAEKLWEAATKIEKDPTIVQGYKSCRDKIHWIYNSKLVRYKDETTGKYGFRNLDSHEIIIPAKYDRVFRFSEKVTPVKMKGKWGMIDKLGKVLVPFEFDFAESFSNGKAYFQKVGQEGRYFDEEGREISNIY